MTTLTIISPCFNESLILPRFWLLLRPTLDSLPARIKVDVLFVNNGSTDQTLEVLRDLRLDDHRIKFLTLSRNFGYQGAIDAGVRAANSDLYCIIDADGEDPPHVILEFLEAIESGADIAYGIRRTRQEPKYRSVLRKIFYRVVGLVADDPFRVDTGEFSMFTNELKSAALDENNSFPFLRASLARVGYVSVGIPHDRASRIGGQSSLNALGMLNFAVGGLLSSSTYPLRLALYLLPLNLGVLFMLGLAAIIWKSMVPATIGIFFALTVIMIQLSFVSVYLGRSYKNGLQRPTSFVIERDSTL